MTAAVDTANAVAGNEPTCHYRCIGSFDQVSELSAAFAANYDHILNDHSQKSSLSLHQTDMRIESGCSCL